MTTTELNQFWDKKLVKIWVVNLKGTGRSRQTDKKIVRAKTSAGALLCAKNNSPDFHNKRCTGNARYADPITDLHCIQIGGQ